MPTVKLLRTTLGGYEVFNLTSAVLAEFFKTEDLSAEIDDVTTVFSTSVPYFAGTLRVFVGGILQGSSYVTESDPGTGEFTITTAPQSYNESLIVVYIAA